MQAALSDLLDRTKPGHGLAQEFYTSPDLYDVEREAIFARNWIYAGHVSQIPNAGDYFLFEMDRESIILVRDRDGQIKAHANVCRHRGSRLCREHEGSAKIFRCPYHAWAYSLDGQLISANNMGSDFDLSQHALKPVQVSIISGLIFISLQASSPTIQPASKALTPILEAFGTSALKIAASESYNIAANWKLAIENYHECYHCGPAHPEYSQHHTLKLPSTEFDAQQTRMRDRWAECGVPDQAYDFQDDKAPIGAQGFAYSRSALFEGSVTGSQSGNALAPLLGRLTQYDRGASDINLGPVSFFLIYSDHMMTFRFLPTGLQSCRCDISWLVHADAQEGKDYSLSALTWLWDITTKADKTIILDNQAGINSRFYDPGPFSEMEQWTKRFIDWYLTQMRATIG
ncbi:MAG: aromatic ring-hydroxylating dioxygenase subunit alpha [Maricaulis sp.]|jgi:Rieske 2Fe-2S family protein|nr:aromatic ring-hydroxylating dioxygenase subunit alpha [Maricaulis sp.]